MNSKEFTGELSRRLGYTNKDAAVLVASLVDIMAQELQESNVLTFQEFGTFEVKKKMERIVVNPVTRQRLLVPPKLSLTFKLCPALKGKVKNEDAQ
ncbi:HU family DNA-binding protein [Phocaeicola coprophilus]|uniref:HU family DNA-binding protein n=1 Tax=Phocaeicola coprophilus TaxID=387090 RepID=UPI003AAC574C